MIARLRSYLVGTGLGPTLVKTVTGSAGLRIAGMAFGFMVGVQLARGLGAEGYGIYGVAMSIISLLMVPTEFGLPQLLTREVAAAKAKGEEGRILGLLRWARRVAGTISALVFLGVAAWLLVRWRSSNPDQVMIMTLAVGALIVPFVSLGKLQAGTLAGLHHPVIGYMPDTLLRPAFNSVLLLLLAASGMSLTPVSAMATGLAAACVACICGAILLRTRLPRCAPILPSQKERMSWLSSALPLTLNQGMRILQGNVIILGLGAISGASAVGLFKVANASYVLIGAPATILTVAASPTIARFLATGDLARLQALLSWATLTLFVVTLLLITPLVIWGRWILGFVFGEEFAAASTALTILCIGGLLSASAGMAGTVLVMARKEKRVTRAALTSLLFLSIILYPLAKMWGETGAAVAAVASMYLLRVIIVNNCRKILGLETGIFPAIRAVVKRFDR